MRFFGRFRAKMNTIGIQNLKLIVTNDYQQFLAHFERFLALFQISDVKPELSPVKLKVCKNGIFWAKNLFQKNFPNRCQFQRPLMVGLNCRYNISIQKCSENPTINS